MKRVQTKSLDDQALQWWVSHPDNDDAFLPINAPVQADDVDEVRALFEGNGRTRPITFGRRCLGATFGNEIVTEEDV